MAVVDATGDQSLCSVSARLFRLTFTLSPLIGFLTLALSPIIGFLTLALSPIIGFFAFALVTLIPLLLIGLGLGHGLSSHSAGWGKASHPDRTAFPEWLPIGPG